MESSFFQCSTNLSSLRPICNEFCTSHSKICNCLILPACHIASRVDIFYIKADVLSRPFLFIADVKGLITHNALLIVTWI